MPNAWRSGHLRDDSTGALAIAISTTKIAGGFALGANDELAVGSGGSYQAGFVRGAGFGMVAQTAGPGTEWRSGFLTDATGAVVIVGYGAATAPLRWQAGYLRDAVGRLVV